MPLCRKQNGRFTKCRSGARLAGLGSTYPDMFDVGARVSRIGGLLTESARVTRVGLRSSGGEALMEIEAHGLKSVVRVRDFQEDNRRPLSPAEHDAWRAAGRPRLGGLGSTSGARPFAKAVWYKRPWRGGVGDATLESPPKRKGSAHYAEQHAHVRDEYDGYSGRTNPRYWVVMDYSQGVIGGVRIGEAASVDEGIAMVNRHFGINPPVKTRR